MGWYFTAPELRCTRAGIINARQLTSKSLKMKMHFISDRPRTPEVVIHAPMEKKGLQTKPTPSASVPIQPTAQKPSFQPPAQPTRNPPQPAAPPPQQPRVGGPAPGGGSPAQPPPPQNNVMQPPRSSTTRPPLGPQLMRPGPAGAAPPSTTNCDISNTTDNTAMFQMPNHQPLRPQSQQSQLQPQPSQTRGRSPGMQPQQAMFQVTSHSVQSQGYQTSQNPRMIGGRLGTIFWIPPYYFNFLFNYNFNFFAPPFAIKGFLDLPTNEKFRSHY